MPKDELLKMMVVEYYKNLSLYWLPWYYTLKFYLFLDNFSGGHLV